MVSICMATYNGERYIREQLNSILSQISDEDEIIISDDSSTDKTIDIIYEYLDKANIKLLKSQKFHSPIFNFENAIKHANGDYIFLCDQDDVWLPNKLNKMKKELEKFDLVVSDCRVVDEKLNIISESFFSILKSGKGFWKNLAINSYLGCCMAFRKDICNYILPFPKGIAMHDIWIGLSVELNGSIKFLNEPLILYRRHGDNASSSSEKSNYSIFYRLKYRIAMLSYLITRKYLNK